MSDAILVVYATRYGSTREVAEAIAAILRDGGATVDVQPARQVRPLEGYRAVILGAPLYIGHWLKDAHRFLARYQPVLAALPVAIFTLGPTRMDEDMSGVRAQMDAELGKYSWLKPVAAELFGGKYDPAKLRFPDNVLTFLPASPLYRVPASDARDWNTIRAWAGELAAKL
ncbi:MAG: flavodoxin [Anaerolineae bacterium]|nr:flavodoxin [Anaerolineae bacterium]